MFDVLIIGSGPAGTILASRLADRGVHVAGLTATDLTQPWPNTYGVWQDEIEALGMGHLLSHTWSDCRVYFGGREILINRVYGLLDNERCKQHLLDRCERGGTVWTHGYAAELRHTPTHSEVTTHAGQVLQARLVIDASGHNAAFVQRMPSDTVAYQAAYGIVGRFSHPPVASNQLSLMDYRYEHLSDVERSGPPTFLYAMDLGAGRYFVEETSLAHAPALPFNLLEQRLHRRLAAMGTRVVEVEHVEHCLFPMNLPQPYFNQRVVGFGGAASMVHPASGYQVSQALRRAPGVAQAIAQALDDDVSVGSLSHAAWHAVWPRERLRNRYLYLFGLATLLGFDEQQLHAFFTSFFHLPTRQWSAYLSDTNTTAELLISMLRLFGATANNVRMGMLQTVGSEHRLLGQALVGNELVLPLNPGR
jgi:lycopene beta-cyclase